MAGPAVEVAPPVRAERRGGLSAVASFRVNERLGAVGALVFQSDSCTFPRPEASRCIAVTPPADKTFDGIVTGDAIGEPFTLYAGVACYAGPDPDHQERARNILEHGRDRALEEALETWAAAGTALPNGGSVSGAIALVEQELDATYVGLGVILMSRADAVRADEAGVLHNIVGRLETINGTPVIASGAVAPGTIYGLGSVTVEESSIVDHAIVDAPKNQRYALAERGYALLVDCEFRVKSATTA